MNDAPTDGQMALWNGVAGQAWVDEQVLLDRILQPFEDVLVEAVAAGLGGRVLDVGCGTGSTTLAVARRLRAGGQCVGVDISEPMVDAARARAARDGAPASFIRADAQTHAFEPAGFDRIISRFGVMFFDDSTLAFANLRQAAKGGARLHFVAWRSAEENPFMTTAERAAAPLLPQVAAREAGAPGQFAFADRHRVHGILKDSGWSEIGIQPMDADCTLPESELVRYISRIGPVGRVLHEVPEPARTRVVERARAAFDRYVRGDQVRFSAACWIVSAQNPGSPEGRDAA